MYTLMDVIKVNSQSSLPKIILLIDVRAKLILIFKGKNTGWRINYILGFCYPLCALCPMPQNNLIQFFFYAFLKTS